MRILLAAAACLAAGLICVRAQDEPVVESEHVPESALSEAFGNDLDALNHSEGPNDVGLVAEYLSQTTKSPKAETGKELNDKSGTKPGPHLAVYRPVKPHNDGNGTVASNKTSHNLFEHQIGHPVNDAGKLPNFGNHAGMSNGTFDVGVNKTVNFMELLAKSYNNSKMTDNGNCTGGNHMTSPGIPKFDLKAILFFMLNATCGELFKAKWEIIKRNRAIAKDVTTTEYVYISNENNLIVTRSHVPSLSNVVSSVSAYDFSKDDASVIHAPMNMLLPCFLSDKRGLTFSIVKENLLIQNNSHAEGNKKDYMTVSSDPLSKGEADALRDSSSGVRCLCSNRAIHRLVNPEKTNEQSTSCTVQVAFLTLHSVLRVEIPVSVLLKSSNLTVNAPPQLD